MSGDKRCEWTFVVSSAVQGSEEHLGSRELSRSWSRLQSDQTYCSEPLHSFNQTSTFIQFHTCLLFIDQLTNTRLPPDACTPPLHHFLSSRADQRDSTATSRTSSPPSSKSTRKLVSSCNWKSSTTCQTLRMTGHSWVSLHPVAHYCLQMSPRHDQVNSRRGADLVDVRICTCPTSTFALTCSLTHA